MNLDQVTTRREAFDLLDGYAELRKEELDHGKTRRPLVKSYMLETVPADHREPNLASIFASVGCELRRLDETLDRVYSNKEGKVIGLLERLHPRYPVIYSLEESAKMDRWVRLLVFGTPELDHLWLSGRAFDRLWQAVLHFTPGHRYGRLVFQHDSLFTSRDTWDTEELADEGADVGSDQIMDEAVTDDEEQIVERRATRFSVVDRLSILQDKLPQMRQLYAPLYSIAQLRFPARGAGGHDLYYNGKVTNRSNSFADHRQHLQYIMKLYRQATTKTEQAAWTSVERTQIPSGPETAILVGSPVILDFSEALSQETFDTFIEATFRRAQGRFRLWGNPIPLGPRKVHVYGLDRHLWQPVFLEITEHHIVAILPRGTCGNTVHRLVTNVQQYLDPAVTATIGGHPYADLIRGEPDPWSMNDEQA